MYNFITTNSESVQLEHYMKVVHHLRVYLLTCSQGFIYSKCIFWKKNCDHLPYLGALQFLLKCFDQLPSLLLHQVCHGATPKPELPEMAQHKATLVLPELLVCQQHTCNNQQKSLFSGVSHL